MTKKEKLRKEWENACQDRTIPCFDFDDFQDFVYFYCENYYDGCYEDFYEEFMECRSGFRCNECRFRKVCDFMKYDEWEEMWLALHPPKPSRKLCERLILLNKGVIE